MNAVEDYIQGRIPQFDLIQRLRHKSGSTLYVRSRAKAVFDEDGRAVRLTGAQYRSDAADRGAGKTGAANAAQQADPR